MPRVKNKIAATCAKGEEQNCCYMCQGWRTKLLLHVPRVKNKISATYAIRAKNKISVTCAKGEKQNFCYMCQGWKTKFLLHMPRVEKKILLHMSRVKNQHIYMLLWKKKNALYYMKIIYLSSRTLNISCCYKVFEPYNPYFKTKPVRLSGNNNPFHVYGR